MLTLKGDGPKPPKPPSRPESKIVYIQKVIKGETYLVMSQASVELEDEFSSLYFTQGTPTNLFLEPPFDPNVLLNLVQTNNILNQCVEVMEVNIDGTGHEFVSVEEGKDPDKKEEALATAFFNEPFPNMSFVSVRRKLRRQMESVGYAYLEILRSVSGDVVGIRNIETAHVRYVKLDNPIQVKKKIERDGKEVDLTIWDRERRFAQRVALKQLIYYREYGSTREVHRETGEWETKEKSIPPEMRGSELLVFGINPDSNTSYYVPRWINQLPSVVGSRNAEEQNLQFLDAGGMPPAIVFIQGGTMIKDTSDQLKNYLSGQNKNKNRAVVVEVQSSSGSLDSQGKVDVKVERFGAERAQDAMFMKYDASTEDHVRKGFRLPPLFLGEATDYSFATAQTSYMVAEAQVFAPERTEFDEAINKTIMKELGFKTIKFKSKPITLKDANAQLTGLEASKDAATRESFLKEMNTVTGMQLELAPMPSPNVAEDGVHPGVPTMSEVPSEQLPASTKPPEMSSPQPVPEEAPPDDRDEEIKDLDVEEKKAKVTMMKAKANKEKKTATELIDLAYDYATLKGLVRKQDLSPERELLVREQVDALTAEELPSFDRLVASYAFVGDDDMALLVAAARTHARTHGD